MDIAVFGTKRKRHPLDISVDVRIIFKCILLKHSMRMWTGFVWLGIGCSGGHRKEDNETAC
jgi:hypothetical protein